MNREHLLLDFTNQAAVSRWKPVDDRVMGGVSRSTMAWSGKDTAIFSGQLSLEQGGGFASVRVMLPSMDIGEASAICLRVKGDGKRYNLVLGTATSPEDIRYQQAFFTTVDGRETIRLPLKDFVPKYRGRSAHEAELLNSAAINSVGLLIADKQDGAFRLEVESITTCHV